MKSIVNAWVFFEKLFPALIFISIFFVMIAEVFCRKFFTLSLSWSAEYCRYALVWVTFTGAAFVRRNDLHIKVDALYNWFVRRGWSGLALAVDCAACVLGILFWFVLTYFGWRLSSRVGLIRASSMNVSMFWLYVSTSIGGVLAGVMEIIALVKLLSGKRTGEAA